MKRIPRVTEEIRLPAELAKICASHAKRLGVSLEEYISYVLMRSIDDQLRAMDLAATTAKYTVEHMP